jgi:hypothetical protein
MSKKPKYKVFKFSLSWNNYIENTKAVSDHIHDTYEQAEMELKEQEYGQMLEIKKVWV